MRRITVLAASAAGVCAFVNCFRPWHHRWGATDDEVALEMPGDELLPVAEFHPTRVITIAARPDEIWPWTSWNSATSS